MPHRKRERVAAIQRQIDDTSRRPSKAPAVGPTEQRATATVSQMNASFAKVPVSSEQARAVQRTPEADAQAALRSGLLTRKLTDWQIELGLMMTDGDLEPLTPADRERFQAMRAEQQQKERHLAPFRSTALIRHGVEQGAYEGGLTDVVGQPHVEARNAVGIMVDPLQDGVVFGSPITMSDGGTIRGQGRPISTTSEEKQETINAWQRRAQSGNFMNPHTQSVQNYPPAYNEVFADFKIEHINAIFLSSNRQPDLDAALLAEAQEFQNLLNTLGRPVPIWELSHQATDAGGVASPTIRVITPAPEPIRPADGSSSSNAATHADASSSSPQTVGSSSAFIDSPAPPLVVPSNMLSDADDSFLPPAAAQFGRSRRTGF